MKLSYGNEMQMTEICMLRIIFLNCIVSVWTLRIHTKETIFVWIKWGHNSLEIIIYVLMKLNVCARCTSIHRWLQYGKSYVILECSFASGIHFRWCWRSCKLMTRKWKLIPCTISAAKNWMEWIENWKMHTNLMLQLRCLFFLFALLIFLLVLSECVSSYWDWGCRGDDENKSYMNLFREWATLNTEYIHVIPFARHLHIG